MKKFFPLRSPGVTVDAYRDFPRLGRMQPLPTSQLVTVEVELPSETCESIDATDPSTHSDSKPSASATSA